MYKLKIIMSKDVASCKLYEDLEKYQNGIINSFKFKQA